MSQNNRKISLFSLTMLALSSLIGSGWLFGSWQAAKVAGPAAILSWIIGGIVIGSIAYSYIELGTMFPEAGGMSKYAQYSHGPLLGFIAAWSNWISLIAIIPIEAVAAVQYMSSWPWSWAKWTHGFLSQGTVTTSGLMVVFVFIIVFMLLNYWSVKVLTSFTNLTSVFKMVVPLLTIICLLASGFHSQNYGSSWHSFMPYGSAPVFAATTVAGIIFSYDAFQIVINMASELKNPKKNIFRGMVISLVICGVVYILLQNTYIASVPVSLVQKSGWSGINFNSPFAQLASLIGLNWLAILLYVEAFISPFGTGVSFTASSSRVLYAMEGNHHIPKFIGQINPKYNIPRAALVTDTVISIIMVTVFRSWSVLASVISTSTLVAYLTGPVTAISLRKMAPNFIRPVKLRFLKFMAPTSFVLASLAIYWAMWPTTVEVILIILLGLLFYIYYEIKQNRTDIKKDLKASWWLIVYLLFMSVMSYLGSSQFKGRNVFSYPMDFVIIIVISLGFYFWGIHTNFISLYFKQGKKINSSLKK